MPTIVYPYLLVLHLFGAIAFAGTVFFEVVILEGVRNRDWLTWINGSADGRAQAAGIPPGRQVSA